MLTRRFQTSPDSDQSISDEEESDREFPNNCAAIVGSAKKKEELPLSSRLEMLKDAGANVYACNLEDELSSDEEGNNMSAKVSVTLGAKKLQKDYVHCIGRSDKEDESCTWSEVSKEAEALMRLNEQTSCSSPKSDYSKVNKSFKGVKDKGKPKISFRFKTQKKGPSCFSVSKNESDMSFKVQQVPEMLKAIEPRTEEYLDSELIEDIQGEEENQLEIVPVDVNELGHGSIEQSMAELLDGLQDKTTMLRGRSKMYRRKRRKKAQPVMKIISSLGDRVIDSESSPEHLGLGSPSNSEADDQILKLDKPEVKRQTLVDRFQEALSDRALVAVPKPLRIGLFGQLQQVVQSEKESDMEFLKNIENGANQNEPSCIDVKILSRYLDAKLTVCHCLFGNNVKRLPWPESPKNTANEETTWTVIFNPRVCDDVDLEVGKCIRIHPPWKEIHVGNDKSIILSVYFSEISI